MSDEGEARVTRAEPKTSTSTGRRESAGRAHVSPPASSRYLSVYVGAVVVAGIAATASAFVLAPPHDLLTLVVFCVLAAAAEYVRVEFWEGSVAVSISLAVILAALVVVGPAGATLAAVCAALPYRVLRRRALAWQKTLFNTAMYALGAAAASLAFVGVGGNFADGHVRFLDLVACIAAVTANFAVNWPLLVVVIHLSSGRRIADLWHDELRWTLGSMAVSALIGFTLGLAFIHFGFVGMMVYLTPLVALRETMRLYTSRARAQIDELRAAHDEVDRTNQMLTQANEELDATNQGLLKTLASVIDARDIYLYGHSVQASKYAGEVARLLEMPTDVVREAELGALLHDIGKIGVSEAILNKPARLTDAEYEEIKTHCDIGYELLISLPHFERVADVVRSHHEHYDGTGYPRGLKGDEIPFAARIVSVVEAVEAMVSDRPYRKGLTAEEVLHELADGAGSQWDPRVVRAFSGILSQDRHHLAMRNSALEVALERAPLAELLAGDDERRVRDTAMTTRGITGTFRSSPQPIFVVADDFTVVSINPAAERLVGWTELSLQGRPWAEIATVAEPRPDVPQSFAGTRRVWLGRADGTPVELGITSVPLRTTSATYWMILVQPEEGEQTDAATVPAPASSDVPTLPGLVRPAEFKAAVNVALASRRRPLCLVLIGLNGYRAIAETFGPEAAEAAMDTLAVVGARVMRSRDVLCRSGEDQVMFLMYDATTEDAARALYRFEEALRDDAAHLEVPVEFCSGVTQADQEDSFDQMLERATMWLEAERRSQRQKERNAPRDSDQKPHLRAI